MPIVLPCRPAHVHVPIVLTDKPPLVCSVPYVVSGECVFVGTPYPITAATGGSGSSQEEGEQKNFTKGMKRKGKVLSPVDIPSGAILLMEIVFMVRAKPFSYDVT